jgi:hypothetical protein
MSDWGFLAVGLVWFAVGTALVVFPRQCQAASKRFEDGKTLIPFPPLVGVPVMLVRVFGLVSFGGAALFFYLFVR